MVGQFYQSVNIDTIVMIRDISESVIIATVVLVGFLVKDSVQQIRFEDSNDPSPADEYERTPYLYSQNGFSELPSNVSIPGANSEIVLSEMNEPDKNRTGILQWILGIAGLTPKPAPVDPDDVPSPEKCYECECGVANKNNRIVGGQETQVNEYPWMTLLKYGKNFYCGAALISDKYLLTAAHCLSGFDYKKITAIFLEHDRIKSNETKIMVRKIVKSIPHPKYNNRNYDNDIALLRLNTSVPLGNSIRPVCVAPEGNAFAGVDAVVTGWGAVKEGGPLASKLQEVTVPILSNEDCKKTSYGPNRITANMMCAGFPEGMKDSCQGDSGGPLHVVLDKKYYEAGVVSWGQGCAEKDYPGVYTRVNNYQQWIAENTKNSCYC